LASLLLAFEPNILTHSHYVTLDFGFTAIFFILYSYFISMLILRKLHMTHFVALGILTGMTLASKVSALLMIPLSFLSTIVIVHRRQALTFLRSQKKGLAVSIVIGIFLLWGTYFFQTGFIIAPGGNENRISRQLYRQAQEDENRTLTRFITLAETVKVPLGTYISMVKNSFIYGRQQGGNIFFLGSFHDSNSPVYGFLTVFMKTPIPLLIFFMFGLSQIALKKLRRLVLLMLIPIAVVFLTSLTGSVQPLIRYLLPMYPFILIVAALGSYKLFTSSKYVVVLLVVWYVMGTVKEYPHFIRYTNELIPSAQRYRNLIDSNIDWGQGLVTLNKYVLGKQPEHVTLSYFGRDDAAAYGFPSTVPWGSYKFEEICSFHDITKRYGDSPPLTIVSVSNWYYCGYYRVEEFARERITGVVADTFLVFR
jgi:4-amino-4-deoxy-L-arabinose transferase-like glycosyltransferase